MSESYFIIDVNTENCAYSEDDLSTFKVELISLLKFKDKIDHNTFNFIIGKEADKLQLIEGNISIFNESEIIHQDLTSLFIKTMIRIHSIIPVMNWSAESYGKIYSSKKGNESKRIIVFEKGRVLPSIIISSIENDN